MTRRMRSPASDSRSGRISGMPPATDASNSRSTPAVAATSNSSAPWRRDQLLVGGDHRLAGLQRLGDQLARRLDPAHDLDHDVDVAGRRRRRASSVNTSAGEVDVAAPLRIADGDACHLRCATPARASISVGVLVDEAHERAADVAAPEQPDPDTSPSSPHRSRTQSRVPTHAWSRRRRSSGVSRRTTTRARRRGRTPPPGAGPCCSWRPSSSRRRRWSAWRARSPARTPGGRWASATRTSPCSQCFPTMVHASGPRLVDAGREERLVAGAVEHRARVVAHARRRPRRRCRRRGSP